MPIRSEPRAFDAATAAASFGENGRDRGTASPLAAATKAEPAYRQAQVTIQQHIDLLAAAIALITTAAAAV